MKCPSCGGRGCTECTNGKILITTCPLDQIDAQTDELMKFAGYVRESGIWPVPGAALEQTPAFMTAEQLIRRDRKTWRAHLGLD